MAVVGKMRHAVILLMLLCTPFLAQGDFKPTQTPTLDGTRATIDLPPSQQMKNVGGSDGAGLCVFTSLQHAARWQNLIELEGYREWMRKRPGGGYPQKVDSTLKAYCQEKGVPVPDYVQHTGGDIMFLELALKTGRCPCITYAGKDDFYRYGIDHMVNLAFLDDTHAAIIDNNRPGTWLWMTRQEFKSRWLDRGGGWAVVFLAPPPTPYSEVPVTEKHELACECKNGDCGDPTCGTGKCTCNAPKMFGQCANGKCVSPTTIQPVSVVPIRMEAPTGTQKFGDTEWFQDEKFMYLVGKGVFDPNKGTWANFNQITQKYEAWGKPPEGLELPALGGVVKDKMGTHEYTKNGEPCTREEAHGTLLDDTDRWHLAIVGDDAFRSKVAADFKTLPPEVQTKLHVQSYKSTAWQVSQLKLKEGVTLRKPANGRVSGDVGVVTTAEYNAGSLIDLMCRPLGPTPKPKPVDPIAPVLGLSQTQKWFLGIGVAVVLVVIVRKRNGSPA